MHRPALQTLTRWLDRAVNSPDAARATRSVVALMVPLLLAAAGLLGPGTRLPLDVTFVALSAQALALVDIRGPYPLRFGFLLTMIAVMVGSTALGTAVGPYPALAALATGLVALNAGVWRHLTPEYGPSLAAPVGLVFLIAAGAAGDHAAAAANLLRSAPGSSAHGSYTLAVLAGCGWALLVQVALWPVRAQHALRQAVGDAWRAASELFDEMAEAGFGDPTRGGGGRPAGLPDRGGGDDGGGRDGAEVGPPSAVATAAGRHRTAMEAAYATLGAVDPARPLVARLEVAMHAAGRMALRAAGLGTALEALADRPDAAALDGRFRAAMEALASTARAVGLAVVSRQPAHLAACEVRLQRAAALLSALRAAVLAEGRSAVAAAPRPPSPAARQVDTVIGLIEDQLADSVLALVALTDRAEERAVFPLELFDVSTWQLRPLAAVLNLSGKPDPALVRFTARLAVLMTLGAAAVGWFRDRVPGHPLPHGYWLPFTILVVSQTDYGATRTRAAERLAGTLVGSVLGSGLLLLELPKPALFAAAGAAGFLFSFFLRREYRLAVVFITLLVVVLTEMAHPVTVELTAERLGLTAAGGALALAAALLFWPAWEKTRFPALLAAALRADAEYVRAVVARLRAGGAYQPDDVRVRRAAERANAAALASLARLYADPANRRGKVERAAALANGSQRVVRYLNLLLVRATPAARPATGPALPAFADRAAAALERLADVVHRGPGPAEQGAAGATAAAAAAAGPADEEVGEFGEVLGRIETELDAMVHSAGDDPAGVS